MNLPISLDTPPRPPEENRRPYFAACLLLFSLTAVVYAPLRQAGFADASVLEGASRLEGPVGDHLLWMFADPGGSPLGRLSHWLDLQLFGMDPAGHRLTSLVFHLLNTILLFGVLWRAFSHIVPAALGAAVFAVHPVNVEALAQLSGRGQLLTLFFWLILLRGYAAGSGDEPPPGALRRAAAAVLGGLSGPAFAAAPAALLAFDAWPLGRWRAGVPSGGGPGACLRIRLREKGGLLAASLLVPAGVWALGPGTAPGTAGAAAWPELLTGPAGHAAGFFRIGDPAWFDGNAPVALLLLAVVSGAAALAGARWPAWKTGWIWFLAASAAAVFPAAAGGVRLAGAAYVPSAGWVVAVASLPSAAFRGGIRRGIAAVVAGVGIVLVLALGASQDLEERRRRAETAPPASSPMTVGDVPNAVPIEKIRGQGGYPGSLRSDGNARGSIPSELMPRT